MDPHMHMHTHKKTTSGREHDQEYKERLRRWKVDDTDKLATADEAIQHRHILATTALHLTDRYEITKHRDADDKKDAMRASSKISSLALDALGSQKASQISYSMEWLKWIHEEIGYDHSEPAPVDMSVKVTSFLTRIEALVKNPEGFSNNPQDLPEGWKGIDGRIDDKRANDLYQVSEGGTLKNRIGAKVVDYDPKKDGPLLATVNSSGKGHVYKVDKNGRLDDHVGARIFIKSK